MPLNVIVTDNIKTTTHNSKQAQAGGCIRLLQIQGRFADRYFHFAKD